MMSGVLGCFFNFGYITEINKKEPPMRQLFFFTIFIFLTNIAWAGEISNAFGFKAGVIASYANHTGESPVFKKSTPGFSPNFSIFKNFPLISRVTLQVSFEWLQQRTIAEIQEEELYYADDPQFAKTSSIFISFPMLCQYKWSSMFLAGGLTPAFLIHSTYEDFAKKPDYPSIPDRWWGYDITDKQERLHLSLRVGIGKVLAIFCQPIVVEIYYWRGFTDFSFRKDKWNEHGLLLLFGLPFE